MNVPIRSSITKVNRYELKECLHVNHYNWRRLVSHPMVLTLATNTSYIFNRIYLNYLKIKSC